RSPHHVHPSPAEHPGPLNRNRHPWHGRGDPRRGGAVVPGTRHPAALPELGQHALRGARPDQGGTLALGVSGARDLLHGARPQPSGRRFARYPRPAIDDEASMTEPLLKVEDLRIALAGEHSYDAVEKVSFAIGRGEAFGLVGESGCGKRITALALMGLLRRPLSLAGGKILLDGQEIQDATPAEMRRLRGERIAMIFQEPMTALNPLSPVGKQIAEMFVLHQGASWSEAMDRAEEALRHVRVPSPERRIKDYAHQLSGGMRQRVMIAIALACGPELLIADEPTTALDVTVQAEIIDLMAELCAAKGTAILMISHDLGLVANMCKRVAVMYAGRIVE